jgi:hypothetical protein
VSSFINAPFYKYFGYGLWTPLRVCCYMSVLARCNGIIAYFRSKNQNCIAEETESCLIHPGPKSFVFHFVIQKYKDKKHTELICGQLFYMNVTLGISHWGRKEHRSKVITSWDWRTHLNLSRRQQQKTAGDATTSMLKFCTTYQILHETSNQEWNGRGM